uniref:Uncharacterized protein n=1 Tax=Arundo donax TaxID=35708 RepID=A0A0A8YD53_ARUDO
MDMIFSRGMAWFWLCCPRGVPLF